MAFKQLGIDPSLASHLRKLIQEEGKIESLVPRSAEAVLLPSLEHEERSITGPDNNEILISIFRRKERLTSTNTTKRLGIYHIHAGGLIGGDRFVTAGWAVSMVDQFDAVCVSVDYRLAPAHPDPAPVEDSYSGWEWMVEHAEELGIDPAKIVLQGTSSGGCLAAGVSLLARDRQGPKAVAMMLFAPMLDDRNDSISALQFEGRAMWDRVQNDNAWKAYLGDRKGTDNVSIYASPSRATDLSGLPPTFIDVGSSETFREESVAFAQQLWKDGVLCELHVWPGAFHDSSLLIPDEPLSVASTTAMKNYIQRLL